MTRVALVRLSALGDLVQSLGAMQSLARCRPDWQIAVVTQAPFAPLLQGLDELPLVIAHDRRGGWCALRATRASLRAFAPDVAVDLQGNWKSALVALASGARRRLGAAARWRQEPGSRVLLNQRVTVPGPRHPWLIAHVLLRELASDLPPALPVLRSSPAEVAAEAAAVRAFGIDPTQPFRILVLCNPQDPRSQRPEASGSEARSAPWPVLWVAGPAEQRVQPPAPAPVLRHRAGELRRLVALGALLRDAGGDVIGPDQGATHVLAAAGAPTTVLFGPQDPAQTAPPAARVLRHPAPPGCMPCRSRRCRHEQGPVCMQFTSWDGVEVPRSGWLPPAPRR